VPSGIRQLAEFETFDDEVDVLVIGLGAAGAAAAIDEVVYANLFEGLTRIDRHGAVVPALAESWEVSDDGRRYRFKLRHGVVFHDGSSFEAGDVVFSLERALADDSVNAQKGLFEAIESVTATGPYEVEVHLKRPSGGFTFDLGWGDAVIVAPESAQTNKSRPTGTGPFRFKRWAQGERIELALRPFELVTLRLR